MKKSGRSFRIGVLTSQFWKKELPRGQFNERVRDFEERFFLEADTINDQTQVVQRVRQFSAVTLAQSFILAFMKKPNASCEDIASMAAAVDVQLSAQAVHERFQPKLVEFFKLLFQSMTKYLVGSQETLASILERFTEVILIDSSTITLPDSQAEEYRGCGGSFSARDEDCGTFTVLCHEARSAIVSQESYATVASLR